MCYVYNQWYDISCVTLYKQVHSKKRNCTKNHRLAERSVTELHANISLKDLIYWVEGICIQHFIHHNRRSTAALLFASHIKAVTTEGQTE